MRLPDGQWLMGYGRQDGVFTCVDVATGKVRWRQEELGAGTVTLAGDKLLVLTEGGILIMAAASPDGQLLLVDHVWVGYFRLVAESAAQDHAGGGCGQVRTIVA